MGGYGKHPISPIKLLGWESLLLVLRGWISVEGMDLGGFVIQCICHAPGLLQNRPFLFETLFPCIPDVALNASPTPSDYYFCLIKMYPFLLVQLPSYLRNTYFTCSLCTGITEQRFQSSSVTFCSCHPQTQTQESQQRPFSHVPVIEAGRKQHTVDKSSLVALESHWYHPPGALTPPSSTALPPPHPTQSTFKDHQSHVYIPYI